jgi:hypothetical protein
VHNAVPGRAVESAKNSNIYPYLLRKLALRKNLDELTMDELSMSGRAWTAQI